MKLLAHLVACIAAIFILQALMPDTIQTSSSTVVIAAGLILWVVNTLVRPVIKLLTLPLTLLTLGLFSLVVNTLMVMLVDFLVPGIDFGGFLPSFFLALLVSVLQVILTRLFKEDR